MVQLLTISHDGLAELGKVLLVAPLTDFFQLIVRFHICFHLHHVDKAQHVDRFDGWLHNVVLPAARGFVSLVRSGRRDDCVCLDNVLEAIVILQGLQAVQRNHPQRELVARYALERQNLVSRVRLKQEKSQLLPLLILQDLLLAEILVA